MSKLRAPILFVLAVLAGGFGAGCANEDAGTLTVIRIWSHQGQEAENTAVRAMVDAFNQAHAGESLRAEVTFFPDYQYAEKVAIAAAAGDLPDAFDLDGPMVARFADAGLIAPIESWISGEDLADFLPTIIAQGTYRGRLYTLGAFDSAVVLYYDREMLERAGVRPPPDAQAWTWAEFVAACQALKAAGIEPLALHMDDRADEWFTYAFSPVVWSGGGALISSDGTDVTGVLASGQNIASLEAWQSLFALGYAATDPIDPDPFGSGSVALDWSGHWMARSHRAAKGGRLGAMPLPRIGDSPVAPSGSWCWALSADSARPEAAARWIRWATATDTGIVPMVRANGAVPARQSAFAAFPEYSELPYSLFRRQLETIARSRPRTPYYATLTQRFAAALRDIARGAPVAGRLLAAEREVQAVIDRRRDDEEDGR